MKGVVLVLYMLNLETDEWGEKGWLDMEFNTATAENHVYYSSVAECQMASVLRIPAILMTMDASIPKILTEEQRMQLSLEDTFTYRYENDQLQFICEYRTNLP